VKELRDFVRRGSGHGKPCFDGVNAGWERPHYGTDAGAPSGDLRFNPLLRHVAQWARASRIRLLPGRDGGPI
jgi:hypothetical protein